MNKLLFANFARLKKCKIFWLCAIIMFGFGVFLSVSTYYDAKAFEYKACLDDIFFTYAPLIGIICSVFISLFLGTEYSDRTMRNKLIIGRTRSTIYLSNLIVNIAAAVVICLFYIAAICAFGIPLIGVFKSDASIIAEYLFGTFMMIISFCAIFTLIGMLIQNKALIAVINVILAFALIIISSAVIDSLQLNVETYPEYTHTNYSAENDIEYSDDGSSPPDKFIIKGVKLDIYEFLIDFLPMGQAIQYRHRIADEPYKMPLYSLGITIVTTGIGIFVFRKKNIR